MQIRGLTPWHVQEHIWNHRFRQLKNGNAANQSLIDCPSSVSDDEAAAILDTYRHSDTLLQNLRSWMSTLRVSTMALVGTHDDTDKLATEVQAARAR